MRGSHCRHNASKFLVRLSVASESERRRKVEKESDEVKQTNLETGGAGSGRVGV